MTQTAMPSVALTALRRSVGVWTFPLLTAAELTNAFARDRVWAIEWQWTAYWSNAATYVVVPMAGAIAAGDSVLYRRRMTADLLSSQTSTSRGQAARVLALALWALTAHLL